MKLCTDILPRRDGTVVAPGAGKLKFVFEDRGEGVLTCDVDDEASLALLLSTANFYPFSDEDIGAALALTGSATGDDADEGHGADGSGHDGDDPDDEDDDNPDDLGDDASGVALPVEAATPPAPARKRSGGKRAGG